MFNFVQVHGRGKFQPEEYIEYFQDQNLSLTPKFDTRGVFQKSRLGPQKGELIVVLKRKNGTKVNL